ncbi:MAG: hypothetical protein ACTSUE_15835 [Promethearchaeota archaeon]
MSTKVDTANQKKNINVMLKETKDELMRYAWADEDPDNIRFKKGKVSGKIGRKDDDKAIVLQMLTFFVYERRIDKVAIEKYAQDPYASYGWMNG